MNLYEWIGAIVAFLTVVVIFIIRDAITVDGPKAKAALQAFAARFKRSG